MPRILAELVVTIPVAVRPGRGTGRSDELRPLFAEELRQLEQVEAQGKTYAAVIEVVAVRYMAH